MNNNSPKKIGERLGHMFKEVKEKRNVLMLATDTLFMVTSNGLETANNSILCWNRTNSCYFEYTYELKNWKVTNEKLKIEINASKNLDILMPDFKKWVETADTSSYNNYGKLHPIHDGSPIGFTVAVKKGSHWKFVPSKSYATIVELLDNK